MTTSLAGIAFAALLAQVTPLPVVTPIVMPATPMPMATTTPAADDPLVRRGPATAPRMLPPMRPTDALIRNSGSTNMAGYTIVVHPDASVDMTMDGELTHATAGLAQVRWLFKKLHAAGPLDVMPGGHCMKSASFGSTTTIVYDGKTSPDLTCGGDMMSRELDRTVNIIAAQIGSGGPRSRGRILR